MTPTITKPDLVDDLKCPCTRIVVTRELERQHDVLECVQRRHEMKGLKNKTDAFGSHARASIFIQLTQIGIVQCYISRRRQVEPAVLFADEPTGNLDLKTARQMLELMLELNRANQTALVVVTHDMDIAGRMEIRWRMEDGKLNRES